MTLLRLIFASALMLMALYIVAMNWGCVIASARNKRNGIEKHYSVVPLISLFIAYFAYLAYPHKPAFWIGLVPAVDIGNWHLLWLPVIFWRNFRERRKTKPSDLSSLHSPTDLGDDGR